MSAETVISISHLSKSFGSLKAVNDLMLTVYKGDVFGFLGPNGAGKSTTIRMILSLITPTDGEIFVFGKNILGSKRKFLKRIGCIIESPDFYQYLSAEKNLGLFGKLSGNSPSKKRIGELIDLVGLSGREKDKVKTFSHGMKQRLGIAQTLVHDPELIILDEPTTGLDPQGIIDVRNLIRRLQSEYGKTVFLSSHQLNEVEQIATRMAIISNGKTIVEGDVGTLLSTQELLVSVEVPDASQVRPIILSSQWSKKLKEVNGHQLIMTLSKEDIPAFAHFLSEAGIAVYSMSYKRPLEDYFLKLTNEANVGAHKN